MKNVVYLITRNDNQQYVGITNQLNKRISAHKKTKRFEMGIKSVEILQECKTYEEAEKLEPLYIEKYDTFYNGLNESVNGKGNHLASNFTTKGYKFTEEQRQNMKDNHWSKKMKNTWTKPGLHSEETRKKWSEKRKGVCWSSRKISRDKALELIEWYNDDSIVFDDDFVRQFVKVTHKDKVGKIPLEELKSPNGKNLNRITLYSEYYSKMYGVTSAAIRRLIKYGIAKEDAK
jgi:predicted GIY-YIG superfamily endonuclease